MNTTHTVRRQAAGLAGAVLAAALVLTGCGGTADSGDETAKATAASTSFPVTVTTDNGDVTIKEQPTRVVALGSTYLDDSVALGVDPIAFSQGSGDDLSDVQWMEGATQAKVDGSLRPKGGTVNVEKVASYSPDIILAADWMVGEDYDRLSKIAPVITSDGTWQSTVTTVGQALGKEQEASEVLQDTEKLISDTRKNSPAEGHTYSFSVWPGEEFFIGDGKIWEDLFGLTPSKTQSSAESVSLENLDQINADVIFVQTYGDFSAVEKDSRWKAFDAVKDGHFIDMDRSVGLASSAPGPQSIKFIVDQVGPKLDNFPTN